MRTTLDIDEDVLAAAKDLAAAKKSTTGRVISDLVRQSLTQPRSDQPVQYRGGFRLLPRTRTIITSELIEKLLEEDT